MAAKNRVFIAFAVEDKTSRDLLVGQARNAKSPFAFVDMSVSEPWDEEWKRQCRSRIKGCDGVIALVSKSTANARGELWEVKTAKEEGVAVRGMYCTVDNRPLSLPVEFSGVAVMNWTWPGIAAFLDSL